MFGAFVGTMMRSYLFVWAGMFAGDVGTDYAYSERIPAPRFKKIGYFMDPGTAYQSIGGNWYLFVQN